MFRILALLCLIAVPALGEWEGGLRVTFGLTGAFTDLPKTKTAAASENWIIQEPPELPSGLESLELWCLYNNSMLCLFYDDTEHICGTQIALPVDQISDSVYDWSSWGYTQWNITDENNETKSYWTYPQFYVSKESLATDLDTRIAKRNSSSSPIQEGAIWVPFNGELYSISTNVTELTGENSDFTKQACIPWMGIHYYYKMTNSTECAADTILPVFPLIWDDQLIGLGFLTFGKLTIEKGQKNWFESPTKAAIQAIVTNGPECLYEYGDSPGVVTMHTYFIEHPRLLTCISLG